MVLGPDVGAPGAGGLAGEQGQVGAPRRPATQPPAPGPPDVIQRVQKLHNDAQMLDNLAMEYANGGDQERAAQMRQQADVLRQQADALMGTTPADYTPPAAPVGAPQTPGPAAPPAKPAPTGGAAAPPSARAAATPAPATPAAPPPPAKTPGELADPLNVSIYGHYRLNADGTVTQDIAQDNPALDNEIKKTYGYQSWMLSVPELKTILYQAVKEGWDPARIIGAVTQTEWYKTHSEAQRKWLEISSTDPATAQTQVKAKIAETSREAVNLGVDVAGDRLSGIATHALQEGWDPAQLREAIINEGVFVTNNKGKKGGLAGEAFNQFNKIANEYMLNISDGTIHDWVRQSLQQGKVDTAGFENYANQQAETMMPWLKPLRAANPNLTPLQAVEPYRQNIARTLELSPDSIDFKDPKWQRTLTQTDSKTGAVTAAPTYMVDQQIRSDPSYGWHFTKQANDQAAALSTKILTEFGEVP